ncbi:ABC transporter substrate-binding protein [Taibaiella chishuiensis]|uniref:ABC-type Fe3+-hydroxamate transport system substrate-binding protein n=1 Tax=Taibaiella chishuiensis TaxID=1434707 RepID=A0A2P8D808_9BACT|nr:helical backbone metal receptor [Taibaiella chishuiensis]PSK93366.1 ABC-type Fe3+-hydroxamate transport system substrate-binding protein [Taibaiella chishuiensis]
MSFLPGPHQLSGLPRRIVSLVPSQTELLYHLGLDETVAGITKFCIHPETWFRSKPRIGGTKTVHFDKVQALAPDLIIANKEENVREQVESLTTIAPVWMSDIHNLQDSEAMIAAVGALTGRTGAAAAINKNIREGFAAIAPPAFAPSVLYLIWRDPWMTVGRDTFIHDILNRIGLQNAWAEADRYPQISAAEISERNPQYIFLSSEPYPFKEKHIAELQAIVPQAHILLVDGEMFSWYGSRLQWAGPYLQALLEQMQQRHQ